MEVPLYIYVQFMCYTCSLYTCDRKLAHGSSVDAEGRDSDVSVRQEEVITNSLTCTPPDSLYTMLCSLVPRPPLTPRTMTFELWGSKVIRKNGARKEGEDLGTRLCLMYRTVEPPKEI